MGAIEEPGTVGRKTRRADGIVYCKRGICAGFEPCRVIGSPFEFLTTKRRSGQFDIGGDTTLDTAAQNRRGEVRPASRITGAPSSSPYRSPFAGSPFRLTLAALVPQ
jgi:hypothetical protein